MAHRSFDFAGSLQFDSDSSDMPLYRRLDRSMHTGAPKIAKAVGIPVLACSSTELLHRPHRAGRYPGQRRGLSKVTETL